MMWQKIVYFCCPNIFGTIQENRIEPLSDTDSIVYGLIIASLAWCVTLDGSLCLNTTCPQVYAKSDKATPPSTQRPIRPVPIIYSIYIYLSFYTLHRLRFQMMSQVNMEAPVSLIFWLFFFFCKQNIRTISIITSLWYITALCSSTYSSTNSSSCWNH